MLRTFPMRTCRPSTIAADLARSEFIPMDPRLQRRHGLIIHENLFYCDQCHPAAP